MFVVKGLCAQFLKLNYHYRRYNNSFYWMLFIVIVYFSIIVVNMLYMFTNLFNSIIFTIIVNMSCDTVSDITSIIHFLCKILIACGIKYIICFNYSVCIMRIIITCVV